MRYSTKVTFAGALIFVVSLAAWLAAPLVLPGYTTILNTFNKNLETLTLTSHESKIIAIFNVTSDSAVIAYSVNSTAINFTVLRNGVPLTSPVQDLALRLNDSGTYDLVAVNTANTTVNAIVTYGVFPYSEAQNFYNLAGIYQSATELFIVLGIVITGYGIFLRWRGR